MVDWEDYHRRNPEAASALRRRRVLIVGLGAMGSHLALAFGRAGTPLVLIDYDSIEVANLHRHSIGEPSYVGWPKVQALADRLRRELPSETSVSPVIGDVLTMDRAWVAGAIANSDLVLDASGNHASRLVLNHLCREQETDFIAPSLWADDHTVGDIYALPYGRWSGNRADRALGCYACDDRVGRPNELSAQAGSFAEIAWVGSAAAEIGLGLLLPEGHRARAMVDRALTSRNYFIFERTPLRMQGGAVEINPDCVECNPRLETASGQGVRRRSTVPANPRRIRRRTRQTVRIIGRSAAIAACVTATIVGVGTVINKAPTHHPLLRNAASAPSSREPTPAEFTPTPSRSSVPPVTAANWLMTAKWMAYGVAAISVANGVLEIASSAPGVPGALVKADACNYRISGEERIKSGAGAGIAVRAKIFENSLSGVAFQYDRQDGALFDSHFPDDTYRHVPVATDGAWHSFAVEVLGFRYQMSLDGLQIFQGETPIPCGDVYFHVWNSTRAYFRNVSFARLATT